jgi:hypothetical protein
MRLTSLFTMLILGTSSVALAQPRYHEVRVPRDQWSMFATHLRIEGRHTVRVEMRDVPVRSIMLQAMRGGADIGVIGIIYTDGTQASLRLDRPLDARTAPNLRFDVGREGLRGVRAITVQGTGNVRFRVLGG